MFTGCSLAYKVLLGVDTTPDWKTEKQLRKQAKKYRIPETYSLVLDTAIFYERLKATYTAQSNYIHVSEEDSSEYFKLDHALKDDVQPVQFRLFDQQGKEIFKLVNCYVDPPIPMNWNVNGCFDSFPPQINIESLNSHYIDLNLLLSCSSKLNKTKLTLTQLPDSAYYGVIIWNDYFQRPSRKLIKTIQQYAEHSAQSIHLIFINNQNAYLWQVMDAATKATVKEKLKKIQS